MAAWDTIIRGGNVIVPDGVRKLDIAVADGRIAQLLPSISGAAREEIDAREWTVFPGLIDPHVHFNEPGRTDWEGFSTGSSALAAGGGTCFFDMPLNASPPTLDAVSFNAKRQAAEMSSWTDFALWGGLTPGNLDTLEELADRGVVGFKAFMSDSGMSPHFSSASISSLSRRLYVLLASESLRWRSNNRRPGGIPVSMLHKASASGVGTSGFVIRSDVRPVRRTTPGAGIRR